MTAGLQSFVEARGLGQTYADDVQHHLTPLLHWIRARWLPRPWVLGISGAQGTGKSTLAQALATVLREQGMRIALLSIDDFYRTKAQRQQLAADVHPLLGTRGVPGTHDIKLALDTLRGLAELGAGGTIELPSFDKAVDDRAPEGQTVEGPLDLIIFEGWCVGLPPQPAADLQQPCNVLERDEDPDGRWRQYVNGQLAGPYRSLFARLGHLIFLRAPDFDCVRRWRAQQEQQTMASRGQPMSGAELERFIAHYERLTRWALHCLPQRADASIELAVDHRITDCRIRRSG